MANKILIDTTDTTETIELSDTTKTSYNATYADNTLINTPVLGNILLTNAPVLGNTK